MEKQTKKYNKTLVNKNAEKNPKIYKKEQKTPNKKRPIKHRKTAKQHKRRKSHKQRGGRVPAPNQEGKVHSDRKTSYQLFQEEILRRKDQILRERKEKQEQLILQLIQQYQLSQPLHYESFLLANGLSLPSRP